MQNRLTQEKFFYPFTIGFTDCLIQDVDCIENAYNQLSTNKDETTVYIHGFQGSKKSLSLQKIVEAYCSRDTAVIAILDWSQLAMGNVTSVANGIPEISKIIASTYNTLKSKEYEISKWHIIGHSMGAHIAGCLAINVDFTFLHITGLDPGGNLFYTDAYHGCLMHPDIANFVDVIYTDMTGFSTINKLGDLNIYVNTGSSPQPGCSSADVHACSHFRSVEIYADAITNGSKYKAIKCPDCFEYEYFKSCKGNDYIYLGPGVNPDADGIYCLHTGKQIIPMPLYLL